MTLTIDLSPTEQAQLTAAAERIRARAFCVGKEDPVTEYLPPEGDAREQARIAAIYAAVGSMAHIGVDVEDLHRERQADKEKEEEYGMGHRL